jgi:uncharacterized protein (TIGR00266 family)
MEVQIGYRPSQSLARVILRENEAVLAESGAMVGMTTNVAVTTQAGGVGASVKRLLGGESMFVNRFTATGGAAEVLLAHKLLGDVVSLEVPAEGLTLEAGAFLASSANVKVQAKVGGLRTMFAGEGFMVLDVTSDGSVSGERGTLLIGAFGGIEEMQCDGELVVDTGHIVAWDPSLSFTIEKSAKGWLATYLSGEGLVCLLRGKGRVWVQSRNPREYAKAVAGALPSRAG